MAGLDGRKTAADVEMRDQFRGVPKALSIRTQNSDPSTTGVETVSCLFQLAIGAVPDDDVSLIDSPFYQNFGQGKGDFGSRGNVFTPEGIDFDADPFSLSKYCFDTL